MEEYQGKRVTFMACSQCNANCEHCYISFSGNREPEELSSAVEALKNKYKIKINGAEPLVNPEYLNSYRIADQSFILTNGIAINTNPDIMARIVNAGIKKIYMSYHFGMHEIISQIPKEVIIENIKTIHDYGLKVYLMTTLSKYNYELIEAICDKAYQLEADGIILNNYLLQGKAITDEKIILTDDDLAIVNLKIEKARRKYPKDCLDICRCGSLGANKLSEHNHFECIAGINQAVITPDNKVYPCFFLTKPGFEMGFFDGEKIMITNPIIHDGSECISFNILNKKKKNQYYK